MNQIFDISSLSLSKKPTFSWPTGSPAQKQNFSLLGSIVYFVAKNPSTPEVYSKLVQSCKYFFEKNPILIVKFIKDNGQRFCSNGTCQYFSEKCCVNIDLTKLSSKIWLIVHCDLFPSDDQSIPAKLCPKIYRCENALLALYQNRMTYENFKMLASTFQKNFLHLIKLTDKDGNDVMFEKILEAIQTFKEIIYFFDDDNPTATVSTMKSISKLQNLENLKHFQLANIPAIIPVQDFADFIKNYKDTSFVLDFSSNFSEEYKTQINELIDTVIASKVPNRLIRYEGQDQENLKCMENLYDF